MSPPPPSTPARRAPFNRLGLDYRAEAARMASPVAPLPIIDAHTHINGARAARIYREARDLFGVGFTYSQTHLADIPAVREALGGTVGFVAIPNWMAADRRHAHTEGFLEGIEGFHRAGARIVKFWNAPRKVDFTEQYGDASMARLDNEWNIRGMRLAESLGYMFMVHVGDPDTWFATKYADASRYGSKPDQYLAFERLMDRFGVPWMAAHMAGWPEDLDFLDGLLGRHPNLILDTSATKWMVRELSRHPRERLVEFLTRWKGRILFGSDIVTTDLHLSPETGPRGLGEGASSPEDAFELYASRYWALRTLLETGYDGESPIADPDLKMVDPSRFDDMSAPRLVGKRLPAELLRSLYVDAAEATLHAWRRGRP
jgi:hypothetical protein